MTGIPHSADTYTSRRLVLRGWGSEAEVMQFAAEGKFELLQDESSDIENGIVRDVIWRITPGIVLQYAMDSRSDCSVFALTGSPAEDVRRITQSIERGVHPWALDQLLTAVDRAKGAQQTREAVLRAGIGAPHEFDKRFHKRIRKALRSKDVTIRSAGIWATSYSRWQEFRSDLEATAHHDPEPELRRDAQIILDHYSGS
ncbi:hypothetical protein [Streptomyces canus]|uniref:hypothetical protein n=1 Tax=Streptomyces canus TaxID=58343 RepID=UPI002DDC3337|nr:hypothetical protein [Streptomyces canus]WSD89901.1 hypothetical protein OG925_38840 [Streptomyces canus]